jgi:ABC-type dipeptide/oligopeptide/nickel transport system permease component
MLKYTLRRILFTIPNLLFIVTLIFVVVRVIPGDPAIAALGDYASKEAVEALRERMGLNDPVLVQYSRFLGDLLHGDLGESMITGMSVAEQVLNVLPYSLELAAFAVVVGVVLGVPLGVVTAVRRNSATDHVGRVFSLAGLSVPAFYLGVLMMLAFAIKLDLLPATGGGQLDNWADNVKHLVLPGITLGLVMTASVTRLSRSAMLNVLGEDYLRTARAKGLRETVVVLRHGLRAAMVPILSVIGIWIVGLIGSSVTTEMVFVRPGLGRLLVSSIMQRDYTTLQSVMVLYTALVAGVNLMTDLTYGLFDPRVRY